MDRGGRRSIRPRLRTDRRLIRSGVKARVCRISFSGELAYEINVPSWYGLNTWEAVYFDHNLATLIELADSAADLGVERFVLDDGWFRGRRDDTAGLGDWTVDATVWPEGLGPLVDQAGPLHRSGG